MAFKILCLDGGGSWAILEAMALGHLYGYKTPGQTILAGFDLAASNSGGSIILAGLAANFTPQDLINFLENEKKRQTMFVKHPLNITGMERYKTPPKLVALQNILGPSGAKPLDQLMSVCKILICTFDYNRARAQFFRSDFNSPAAGSKGSPQPTLAEAVHASTNAPVKYFDSPAQFATPAFAGCRYWDGAMGGFNNPVMAAVTEALAYGTTPTDLRVLSIGTGNVFLPMPAPPLPTPGSSGQNPNCVNLKTSGFIHDVEFAATIVLDDPPDQASFMAHLIASGANALSQDPAKPVITGNIVRLNPWIQPVRTAGGWAAPSLLAYVSNPSTVPTNYATDDEAFQALVNLDMDAIEQEQVDLITMLGKAWIADAVPNQAIRATPDLQPLIGHGRFSAALAQARVLGLA